MRAKKEMDDFIFSLIAAFMVFGLLYAISILVIIYVETR